MKLKIHFLFIVVSISFSYSHNLLFSQRKAIFNNINNKIFQSDNDNLKDMGLVKVLSEVFKKFFKECGEEFDLNDESLVGNHKYPVMFSYIGLNVNDLEDEMECLKIFENTTFIIAIVKDREFTNIDDLILQNFLDLHQYIIGGCYTYNCREPLIKIIDLFQGFKLKDENNKETKKAFSRFSAEDQIYDLIIDENEDETNNNFITFLITIFVIYIFIKIIIGTTRLIYIPKGYEIFVAKILNKKGKMPFFKGNDKENLQFNFNINIENEGSVSKNYNPIYDLSSYYPKILRIMRFFDFFNDSMLLTTIRNRYFNDNGLEIINFLRAIVLFFYIFSNTFTSVVALPPKDILNKEFFSSNTLLFYRFSSNAGVCWIFLEAAYTSYKSMKFIKIKMYEYVVNNNNKRYYFNIIIILGKFMLFYISKIIIFILCYYYFYHDIIKFKNFFNAKTTYKYMVEKVIKADKIKCDEDQPFYIFSNFFTFTRRASNLNKCYDFTYIYINIFFCIFIYMISIYIILIVRKFIVEIFFIIFYLVFFFGLTFIVKDKTSDIYTYYHFKGQEYTTKIFYLAMCIYNLGFILGIICFNYDDINNPYKDLVEKKNYDMMINSFNLINNNIDKKEERIKNGENNDKNEEYTEISKYTNESSTLNTSNLSFDDILLYEKKAYYPYSFLNNILKRISNLSFKIKIIIILICLSIQLFISGFFKLYSYITKNDDKNKEKKKSPNFDRNYVLQMDYNWVLKGYFLLEKHFFLLLFFIISVVLITFPRNGIFYDLSKSRLITAISRVGFTIVILSYIIINFTICGFLIKIKMTITSLIFISLGDFLLIFVLCFLINIVLELPIRKLIKKLYRKNQKQKEIILEVESIKSIFKQ